MIEIYMVISNHYTAKYLYDNIPSQTVFRIHESKNILDNKILYLIILFLFFTFFSHYEHSKGTKNFNKRWPSSSLQKEIHEKSVEFGAKCNKCWKKISQHFF